MYRITFPYIDMSLQLKTMTKCANDIDIKCINYYDFRELYTTLNSIEKYELGGEYNPDKGFLIDPRVSYYDKDQDRPYTILNFSRDIVWHSHPFNYEKNAYPSIEDIDAVRVHHRLIFLLVTYKGVYVLSATRPYTSIDNVVGFYQYMQPNTKSCSEWNYDELEKSFIENRGYNDDIVHKYGIVSVMIPNQDVTRDSINKTIQRVKKLRCCSSTPLEVKRNTSISSNF